MVSLLWRRILLFVGLYLAGSAVGNFGFVVGYNIWAFIVGCALAAWFLLDK